MDSPGPLYYLVIVVCLVLSALFSSSETAISTVNRLHLKRSAEKGSRKAKTALSVIDQFDKALYTILVGNNIVNIASSAVATVIFTSLLGASGPAVATVVMTVLVLTFGEILPKSYGKDQNEKVALALSGPLKALMVVLTPVTWLFMKLRNAISPPAKEGPTVTEEDLHYLIESVEEEGVIEEQERDLVQSALEFDDTDIKDILTPRVNMVALDVEDDLDTIKETLLEEGYSRIPVYEGSVDNIIGILMAKDYLRKLIEEETPDLREMLSKPAFVHRSMKLSGLLAFFKAKKVNMAMVTDDYGGTLGLVTTQDIIEELVGDMWDEDDEDEPEAFIQLDSNTCEVRGAYPLRDLMEEQGWEDFTFEGDFSTVNGWAMQLYGHIPENGESVLHENLLLTVMEMDGNRIDILKITRKKPGQPDKSGEETGEKED
ncbi:hemolysin family protein [Ruminococcaceae bacterium OttesenSCG-928-L11]|nr:hemolysin family protein [Ruminococcaceae bacterium OttesenSCG-928-L11]